MRYGGAACKLPVPVKEASPEYQLNPDFINPTHFFARSKRPQLPYLVGCQRQSHQNPSPSAHPPLLLDSTLLLRHPVLMASMELNGCDDEDEALRRAIAASLGESATTPTTDDVPGSANKVDKGLGQGHAQGHAQDKADTADTRHSSSAGGLAMGMLGIDRRKMEEERLARLKKRKAGPTNLGSHTHDGRDPELPPAQRPRLMSGMASLPGNSTGSPGMSQPSLPSATSSLNSNSSASKGVSEAGLPYPQGVVRRTRTVGYARRDDDITIDEVLQRDTLELAVLSSFQWDEKWLLDKLNLGKTKVLLIAYAEDEETVSHAPVSPRRTPSRATASSASR